jgi:AraC family transcriptional regulator
MKGSFGRRLGEICGAEEAPMVFARSLRNTSMVATRLVVARPGHEKKPPLGIEEAFIVAVTFQEGYFRDNWMDGRPMPYEPPQPAGSVSLMDLRYVNETRFKSPVDSVQFYFPRRSLNTIADASQLSRMDEIQSPINVLRPEPTLAQLAAALKPAFLKPDEVSQLFLDHLMTAAALHLMTCHGGALTLSRKSRGGLAPWQLRRVEELIEANLDGALSLDDLASSCRISPRHFARAFTQSNGVPPHKWLLQKRTERAKDLLRTSKLSLVEIAEATGFSSQSHLTRVFSQTVGQSPAAWRRMCKL